MPLVISQKKKKKLKKAKQTNQEPKTTNTHTYTIALRLNALGKKTNLYKSRLGNNNSKMIQN